MVWCCAPICNDWEPDKAIVVDTIATLTEVLPVDSYKVSSQVERSEIFCSRRKLGVEEEPWNEQDVLTLDIVVDGRYGGLGAVLDATSEGLQVLQVGDGALQRHNAMSFSEELRVLANDFIVSVNGATHPKDMLAAITLSAPISLRVVRPRVSTVRIHKGPHPFGVLLGHNEGVSHSLEVQHISASGTVGLYNSTVPSAAQVHVGDFVVAVNGETALETMLDIFHQNASGEVQISLLKLR